MFSLCSQGMTMEFPVFLYIYRVLHISAKQGIMPQLYWSVLFQVLTCALHSLLYEKESLRELDFMITIHTQAFCIVNAAFPDT